MSGNNQNAGKGVFVNLAAKPETKPGEETPGAGESEKVRTTVEKVIKSAKKATDTDGLQNTAKPPKKVVLRSIQYSPEMYDKMTKLKKEKGPDYNWQVNKALEYWFENVHKDIE